MLRTTFRNVSEALALSSVLSYFCRLVGSLRTSKAWEQPHRTHAWHHRAVAGNKQQAEHAGPQGVLPITLCQRFPLYSARAIAPASGPGPHATPAFFNPRLLWFPLLTIPQTDALTPNRGQAEGPLGLGQNRPNVRLTWVKNDVFQSCPRSTWDAWTHRSGSIGARVDTVRPTKKATRVKMGHVGTTN